MSNIQLDDLTAVDFFTSSHRISGQVQTGTKPLCDVLNDGSQSFLQVFNVYVSRLDEPAAIGAYTPMAYLSKENMSFVIVSAREVRAPDQGRFTAHDYDALLTLPGVEVRGRFAGPHRLDLRTFSPAALDAFVTLREASVQLLDLPDVTFNGEAVLVNRARLESMGLSE
jgi:hypothetical protein